MSKEKRVSLKDVAVRIGVSTTLVSIVLNGKARQYRIGEEMEQRVLHAAREMNYSPNLVARNLRGGTTNLIGLIVADISNPFFSMLARLIENRAHELNYTVIFGSSDENVKKTRQLVDVLVSKGVDGFIVVPCDGSEDIIRELDERGMHVVLMDRNFPELNVSFSCIDNRKATYIATKHLIEQKFVNISLMAFESQTNNVLERIAGYDDAMKDAGLSHKINVKKVNMADPQPQVCEAMELLAREEKAEAIIFSNNTLSILGLHCLNDMKIRVPEEIAVVGFDEADVFDLFYSPVTYIEQPVVDIAVAAVDILVDKIKNGQHATQTSVILNPRLVIRASSLKITQ